MKNILFLAVILFLAWHYNGSLSDKSMPSSELTIVSNQTEHHFTVELAQTALQKRTGLMHRTELGATNGMLFFHNNPTIISMWMKNTLIPLDMIFIDEAGIIIKIHHNAQPHSEEAISSEKPTKAVLEINGGLAEKLNINHGDKVIYANTFTP